jgi:hypothetical protein
MLKKFSGFFIDNDWQKLAPNLLSEMGLLVVIESPDHAESKLVGLIFRVHPENIMGQFVVHRADPFSFRIVFSALFPIFRMHQMDDPILVSFACRPSPIEVLKPLHLGHFQAIKAAEISGGFLEIGGFITAEK